MTPERWRQVQELCHATLARAEEDRAAFLATACAGDDALRGDVESLLAQEPDAAAFMSVPAVVVASAVLDHAKGELVGRRLGSYVPGTRLGPYEIQELIASGGMGEVYQARDVRLGRQIALKLLPPHLMGDSERLRRFEQEARSASALNHPNIITIYDVGEFGEGRFIAMELVAGRSLRTLIGPASGVASIVRIGTQIARALSVAHAAGIVHRDIKPENVMLRDDGYVKVLDFGLAQLDESRDTNSLAITQIETQPGTLIGTLRYMSPEQARGTQATDASDVFALGAVLYELATGHHPFEAGSLLDLLRAIEEDTPAAPSSLSPVPAAFDDVIARMLAKDPRRRPSASDIVGLLESLVDGDAHELSPPLCAPLESKRNRRLYDRRGALVGRDREIAILNQTFDAAQSGRGSLICLAGEPGIGKTSIAESFLADLSRVHRRIRIGYGRCSERLAGTDAYLPWLEALAAIMRDDPGAAATLRRVAPSWYAQIARAAPRAETDASAPGTPTTSQEQVKHELSLLLEALSGTDPLVLLFDDLHWADISTTDLLSYVGTRLASLRVLLVVTYRPSDLQLAKHPFLQVKRDLQARGACHDLALEFLTPKDVADYLALEFADHALPDELRDLIHSKTEGNPLFMTDVVHDLRARGIIATVDGQWQLVQSLPSIERDMPQSIRAMIDRKLAQLEEDDLRLLVAASVRGFRFEASIVGRALGLDAEAIEDRLTPLERAHGLVRVVEERELADGTLTLGCQFVHVLYQTALYATLTPARRVSLSRKVADALRDAYADQQSIAGALASLYETARDFATAAQHYLRAAENALRLFANHEAAALARCGIHALDNAAPAADRTGTLLALKLGLGSALMHTRGYSAEDVQSIYGDAVALARATGHARGLNEGIWGLAHFHMIRANFDETLRLATELLERGKADRDSTMLVNAHYLLGTAHLYLGRLEASQHYYEQGLVVEELSPTGKLRFPDGRNPAVMFRSQLARVLWLRGLAEDAALSSHLAQSIAEQEGQPLGIVFAVFLDAMFQQLRLNVVEAERQAARLITLARDHALPQYAAWGGILHGWSTAAGGSLDGIAELRDHLEAQSRLGSELSRPHFLALLADSLLRHGQYDEGLAAVSDGFTRSARTGEQYYEAELHRLRGELLAASGAPPADVEACFRTAIAVAEGQGAVALMLRGALSLARLGSSNNVDARAVLSRALDRMSQGASELEVGLAVATLTPPPPS